MQKKLIEIALDGNSKIYFETENYDFQNDDNLFIDVSSSTKVLKKTKEFFYERLEQIKFFSKNLSDAISSIDMQPDEFEVEFSVKFAGEAGVVFSSVSSETGILIKLKWGKHNHE